MITPKPEELIGNRNKLVLRVLFENDSDTDAVFISKSLGMSYLSTWRHLNLLYSKGLASKQKYIERVGGFSSKKLIKWKITKGGKNRVNALMIKNQEEVQ